MNWKILVLLFLNLTVYAQRIDIKGTIKESESKPVTNASIFLLKTDSTYVGMIHSDNLGNFFFRNITSGKYILKVSHINFNTFVQRISKQDKNIDMGILIMNEKSNELSEVIVRPNPVQLKGDTIEYHVNAFKVTEGAMVEELLKKLPAINMTPDGEITVMGQSVVNVTIDGKPFFGNDIKMATKNLPANAFSKVQVYNYQSELSKLTNTQNVEGKTINIELKKNFRGKTFGLLSSGVGTKLSKKQLYQAKVGVNNFRSKKQFSIIGYSNNDNNGGMLWSDYPELRIKNQSQNHFLGFGGNIPIDGDSENDFLLLLLAESLNKNGFQKNSLVGVNFNQDIKKTAFQNHYYFSQNQQLAESNSAKRYYFENNTMLSKDSSNQRSISENHNLTTHYENTIDSSNTIIVSINFLSNKKNTSLNNHQRFYADDNFIGDNILNNEQITKNLSVLPIIIFRHKFKKVNRNIVGSFNYLTAYQTNHYVQNSNSFLIEPNIREKSIHQTIENLLAKTKFKANILFTEPLTKQIYWDTFLNYSQKNQLINSQIYKNKTSVLDSLSYKYYNNVIYKRFGTNFRIEKDALNFNTGVAFQTIHMVDYVENLFKSETRNNKTFKNYIPYISLNSNFGKSHFYGDYTKVVAPPPIFALQPIIDVSNPFYISLGNSNLTSVISQHFNLGFSYFYPATFSNFYINSSFIKYSSQIIYTQNINKETGVIQITPINASSGNVLNTYCGFEYPIIKNNFTFRMNINSNLENKPIQVNTIFYNSKINYLQATPKIQLNLFTQFLLNLEGGFGVNKVRYDNGVMPAQYISNMNLRADLNFRLYKDINLNSAFDFKKYNNRTQEQKVSVPLWNASINGTFGKSKKIDIRLSIYDILKRNTGIIQAIDQNFAFQSQTNTISRYFMLSLAYRMKPKSNEK